MRPVLRYVTALLLLGICSTDSAGVSADNRGEPANSDGQRAIVGTVVDDTGAPVIGAKVALYRLESPTQRWGRFKITHEGVATNDAGSYRFQGLQDDYFMVSVEQVGFARAFRAATVESQATAQADVVLKPPALAVISLVDPAGKPVVGARVRELLQRGANGELRHRQVFLKTLGIEIPPSDGAGRLQLPPLPTGDTVRVTIDHPGLAPAQTGEIRVAAGATASVSMQPGVTVTLHAPIDRVNDRITALDVDLRHVDTRTHPSTIWFYEVEFDAEGTTRLTVAPGDYTWLWLKHDDYFVTPVYEANFRKKNWLRIEPGRNEDLYLNVRRKVTARGRIVNAETGKPVPEATVKGELENGPLKGWDDRPGDGWSFAGWSDSDADGQYQIDLAEGAARISFQGTGYLPEQEYYRVSVAADGSTVLPEIRVRPVAKITGLVKNQDGSPAARVIIRLRGKSMAGLQPILTDAEGRFEIQPRFVPFDEETGRRAVVQNLVALDPYRPLAASVEVRLDKPHDAVLTLEPHNPDLSRTAFPDELTDWARGIVEPAEAARNAAVSLRGKSPPELDGVLWLNTDDRPLTLAGLRGKYVLLDFWFTGCGPCHGDFPSVKLVHELYKDHGVVVIGVHNSSGDPEAVRAHVAKIGLPFPIVLDHPDGRTVARFEPHGIPDGYPDYVLISPEGKVLLDDRTIPHPTLRGYKLEIIRQLLLESPVPVK